nr:hypothetical protein BaRGS_031338 [Batillaria attramentaria]
MDMGPIDLDQYSSADELEPLGLEHLKVELMRRGLKCGGLWYQDMSCRIAHAGQLSESSEVKTRDSQGCLLYPFLFLLVVDWIMKATTTGRKNGIQWTLWTHS